MNQPRSMKTGFHVAADLDAWSEYPWSDGVQINTLQRFDRLFVRTRNSVYDIMIVSPGAGEALVRGGQFFPEYQPARLAGCSLGGSFLKVLGIYVGFQMEWQRRDSVIFTTKVRSITQAVVSVPRVQ